MPFQSQSPQQELIPERPVINGSPAASLILPATALIMQKLFLYFEPPEKRDGLRIQNLPEPFPYGFPMNILEESLDVISPFQPVIDHEGMFKNIKNQNR